MARDSFIFYKSFYEAIEDLDSESQLSLYNAICRKSLYDEDIELDGIAGTLYKLIKPQLDANNERYANGKKGGRPKKETIGFENKKTIGFEIKKPNNNNNENVNVNDKEKINKKKFQKPTLQDIQNYCKEKNYEIDIQYFIDYYESNGWKVGRNPMKDWKATVRTWSQREKKGTPIKPKKASNFEQREYGDLSYLYANGGTND